MGKFSTLSVGISGLQVAQAGLYVTGHNMANVDTIGFTRQQALQKDFMSVTIGYSMVGAKQVGLGTDVAGIRQIRNNFLDLSYRAEAGKYGFYLAKATTGHELEAINGELQSRYSTDSVFKDLYNSLQELSFDASSLSVRGNLVSTAVTFVDKVANVYNRTLEYQYNLDLQIRETVQEVNRLLNDIERLNKLIMDAEMSGDRANDYRDSRNVCLDQLSHLMKIDYREDPRTGRININAEGKELLMNGVVNQIGLRYCGPNNSFVEPVFTRSNTILSWDADAQTVFDYTRNINANLQNDYGHLKGLMVSRGMFMTTYASEKIDINATDFPQRTRPGGAWMSYDDARANMATDPNALAWYNYHNYQLAVKNNFNLNCLIPKTMQEFDTIVHEVVTMINNAVCPLLTPYTSSTEGLVYQNSNGVWTDANGIPIPEGTDLGTLTRNTALPVIVDPTSPYNLYYNNEPYSATNPNGYIEIFSRKNVDRYDANGNYNQEYPTYDHTAPYATGYFSLYTSGNLIINPLLVDSGGYNRIALMTTETNDPNSAVSGLTDNTKVLNDLLDKWKSGFINLGDGQNLSVDDAYRRYVTNLGIDVSESSGFVNEQSNLLVLTDNKRQAISAVSLDEEMRNMMVYQHAYNASARVINVVDSMIDRVVNGMGRAGR